MLKEKLIKILGEKRGNQILGMIIVVAITAILAVVITPKLGNSITEQGDSAIERIGDIESELDIK